MQFRVIVVTDHPPTNRQDRLQYTVPQLACSVTEERSSSQSFGNGENQDEFIVAELHSEGALDAGTRRAFNAGSNSKLSACLFF